jgi:hypothetical protein
MRRTKAAMMVATVAALTVLPLATTATAQAAARTPEWLNCSTDSLRHEKFNGAALSIPTRPLPIARTLPIGRLSFGSTWFADWR